MVTWIVGGTAVEFAVLAAVVVVRCVVVVDLGVGIVVLRVVWVVVLVVGTVVLPEGQVSPQKQACEVGHNKV